jgi:methionyl-tRNA formyltransferase
VPSLDALVAAGFDVALVVTAPDRRRGRRAAPTPTPVKEAALAHGIPVTDDLDDLIGAGVDLGVVVAFGRILPRTLLERVPMVNVHFSLLPRWRGAAPVERALLAGDDRTGVCVMAVEEGLDTGAVYARAEVPISSTATAPELLATLADRGARLLVETLREGLGTPEPQVGEPTYASKIGPSDLELRWERSAEELHRVVRVGGAWTTVDGSRLKVHRARPLPDAEGPPPAGSLHAERVTTGLGTLELVEVQPEGRSRVDVGSWLRGARRDGPVVLGREGPST